MLLCKMFKIRPYRKLRETSGLKRKRPKKDAKWPEIKNFLEIRTLFMTELVVQN